MATYLSKDTLPQTPLFTPNFGLIQQVLQTKQSEYDRGFAAVRSLRNSLLNADVTNSQNKEFKDKTFKAIQENINKIANQDLSNPQAVTEAMKVFDPLINDQELIHDISVTKRLQRANSTMMAYKNSMDPETKKQYSQYAERHIAYATERLANANRGDMSILNEQGADFVPFADVNEYLAEAAKEEGLEIKIDSQNGLYLESTVNGPESVPVFSAWAATKLSGGQFDQQFQVEGSVKTEDLIRSKMAQGMTREQATLSVAEQLRPELIDSHARSGEVISNDIKIVSDKIKNLENAYNGVPPKGKKDALLYNSLIDQKKNLEKALEYTKGKSKVLMSSDLMQVASNLSSLATNELMSSAAVNWASAYAMSTMEYELKPDQAAMMLAEQDFKWQFEQMKMSTQYTYDLDILNREQDFEATQKELDRQAGIAEALIGASGRGKSIKFNADGTININASLNGEEIEDAGIYTPQVERSEAGFTVLNNELAASASEAITAAFAADGAIASVYGSDNPLYQSAIIVGNYLNGILTGDPSTTSGEQPDVTPHLRKLAEDLNINLGDIPRIGPNNKKLAAVVSNMLSVGIARKFNSFMHNKEKENGFTEADYREFEIAQTLIQTAELAAADYKRINDEEQKVLQAIVLDENGKIKEEFKDRFNYTSGFAGMSYAEGTKMSKDAPKYITALPGKGLTALEMKKYEAILPQRYYDQAATSGAKFISHGLSAGKFSQLIDRNNITEIYSDGENITAEYINGETELDERFISNIVANDLYGSGYEASVDPVNNTVRLKFNINPNSDSYKALTKSDKKGEQLKEYEIVMSTQKFASIQSDNPDILEKLNIADKSRSRIRTQFGRDIEKGKSYVNLDSYFESSLPGTTINLTRTSTGQTAFVINGKRRVASTDLTEGFQTKMESFSQILPIGGTKPTPYEIEQLEQAVLATARNIYTHNNFMYVQSESLTVDESE